MAITVINNFISHDEAKPIIDFIDNNLNLFNHNEERYRWMLRFGYDEELPEQARHSMFYVDPIRDNLANIFTDVASMIHDDVFLTSWFLSKQVSGGKLNPHLDGVDGMNQHLEYTAMLYLNDLDGNGTISFPDYNMSITPKCGDLVIFKSKEDMHQVSDISQDRYSLPMWFTKDPRFIFNV